MGERARRGKRRIMRQKGEIEKNFKRERSKM